MAQTSNNDDYTVKATPICGFIIQIYNEKLQISAALTDTTYMGFGFGLIEL